MTPNQQPIDPIAVRERLRRLFQLLGIATNVEVARFGPHFAIAFSPLWVADAHKLAEALDKIPELKPYGDRVPVTAKEE